MLTMILGCGVAVGLAVALYLKNRLVGQAIGSGLVLCGLAVGGVFAVSHWRAVHAMAEVSLKSEKTLAIASADGAIERLGGTYSVMLETDLGAQVKKLPCGRTEVVRLEGAKLRVEVFGTRLGPDAGYDPRPWLIRFEPAERVGEPLYLLHLRPGTVVVGGEAEGAQGSMARALVEKRAARDAERLAAAAERDAASAAARAARADEKAAKDAERLARAAEAEEAKRAAKEEAEAEAAAERAADLAEADAMGTEARQAARDLNFAKAFALSEQIKGVAGWDEVDGLRARVGEVDALVGAYVQRQQQAAAAAAWQAQVRAQQVAVAQARAEYARAQAALRPSSTGGRGSSSLKERAASLRDRAIQHKCLKCGQNFTESREEHAAHCTGSRN